MGKLVRKGGAVSGSACIYLVLIWVNFVAMASQKTIFDNNGAVGLPRLGIKTHCRTAITDDPTFEILKAARSLVTLLCHATCCKVAEEHGANGTTLHMSFMHYK